MELLELSLPNWTQPVEEERLDPVPCFSAKNEKHGTPEFPYTGDVPAWVEVLFSFTEEETIRAYRKVEAIHARYGEEAAQKWIVENSRNFLDNTIDV